MQISADLFRGQDNAFGWREGTGCVEKGQIVKKSRQCEPKGKRIGEIRNEDGARPKKIIKSSSR